MSDTGGERRGKGGTVESRKKHFIAEESEVQRAGHKRSSGAPEWLPIETAPKDGTWVLLAGGSVFDGEAHECELVATASQKVVAAFFEPEWDEWLYAYWDMGWRSVYLNPTHWMPLPEVVRPLR